jgi:MiaB/RimO family radical SAM methylthiotransferase
MAKNKNKVKIFFLTYGCTFNLADTDAMAKAVESSGKYAKAKKEADADVVVINSCSVKDATQQKILFQAKKLENAGKRLVITGCLAQVSPEIIEKAVPKASIVGIWSNAKITEAVGSATAGKKIVSTKKTAVLPFNVTVDGIFARVQISRGCLGRCTYCSTKLARGHLQSFPQEQVVPAVGTAVAKGAKEIQLTSQDAACYGFDFAGDEKERDGKKSCSKEAGEKENLATLVKKICAIPGRFRVRIGMGNPEHFEKIKEPLATAMKDEKVYKFLHIPVQAGSDSVLKAMGRKYTAKDYEKLVDFFSKKIPGITIETDVIVGFPNETDEDFNKTVALVKATRPQVTNVSKYSARPRTAAAKMEQVERNEIKARSSKMSALCKKIALEENKKMVGKEFGVLVTEKAKGYFSGRTPNYKTALVERASVGEFLNVRIVGAGQSHLKARVVP